MNKRMSIVLFSGTTDKLITAAMLAAGATAMDLEVELLLTSWALAAFRKGALVREPRISADFADDGPALIRQMQARSAPHWLTTIRDAREIGRLKIFACSAWMELLDITLEDLEDVVDEVTGVASFIDRAKDAETMFI